MESLLVGRSKTVKGYSMLICDLLYILIAIFVRPPESHDHEKINAYLRSGKIYRVKRDEIYDHKGIFSKYGKMCIVI